MKPQLMWSHNSTFLRFPSLAMAWMESLMSWVTMDASVMSLIKRYSIDDLFMLLTKDVMPCFVKESPFTEILRCFRFCSWPRASKTESSQSRPLSSKWDSFGLESRMVFAELTSRDGVIILRNSSPWSEFTSFFSKSSSLSSVSDTVMTEDCPELKEDLDKKLIVRWVKFWFLRKRARLDMTSLLRLASILSFLSLGRDLGLPPKLMSLIIMCRSVTDCDAPEDMNSDPESPLSLIFNLFIPLGRNIKESPRISFTTSKHLSIGHVLSMTRIIFGCIEWMDRCLKTGSGSTDLILKAGIWRHTIWHPYESKINWVKESAWVLSSRRRIWGETKITSRAGRLSMAFKTWLRSWFSFKSVISKAVKSKECVSSSVEQHESLITGSRLVMTPKDSCFVRMSLRILRKERHTRMYLNRDRRGSLFRISRMVFSSRDSMEGLIGWWTTTVDFGD